MDKIYVYDWLDKQCSYDLNPELVYPGAISQQETQTLSALIGQEVEKVEKQLKELFFKERKGEQLALLVHKYHDMLIVMMNKVYRHLHHTYCGPTGLHTLLLFLQERFEHLLKFFEQHFATYITEDLKVPRLRLLAIKKTLLKQWELLQSKVQHQLTGGIINIVHHVLQVFILRIEQQKDITIREVNYHRQLMEDLLQNYKTDAAIKEVLIFRNLNDKRSTSYFSKQIEINLSHLSTFEEKLNWVRLEYKAMQQRRVSRKTVYDPHYPKLKEYLCEYMENEMLHLEQKIEGIKPLEEQTGVEPNFKVLCSLSTDQIAVVLRAADEAKVLIARSLNAVFKAIVPYLSTQKKKDISWQSVRTKSYDTEERDKEIAIAALEEMIKRIREY